jgi:hypothetical protein
MTDPDSLRGISDYLFDKLSREIGDDRIIPLGPNKIAYIETETCEVYVVTVQLGRIEVAG